ncbi:MAG: DUF5681 domain-containing protein [Rhodoplanes sp.]
MAANKTTAKPSKGSQHGYTIGFGKPPKASQFKPGQSGNPKGRPKGHPTIEQLLLEEAARLVKVRVGDTIIHVPKQQALIRKLFDAGLQGDLHAARLALSWLERAQAAMDQAPPPQLPLSADEIELFKLMVKGGHSS